MVSACAGDTNAGRALLQHGMVSLDDLLRGRPLGDADRVALEHLLRCLREFLVDGLPLERAFCLEKSAGAPKDAGRPVRDAVRYEAVVQELKAQAIRGEQRSIARAQEVVATREKVSRATIRAAWERVGGTNKLNQERDLMPKKPR